VFSLETTVDYTRHELVISNYPVDPGQDPRQLALRPYEARVYRLLGD